MSRGTELCLILLRPSCLNRAQTHLPVVEDGERESLSLCVGPQVCLKPKRIDGWDEGFDGVERRARDRSVLCHVASVNTSRD